MILPFSMMDVVVAKEVNKNPKDKTFERQQEKLDREIISQNLKAKHLEKEELEKQIKSEQDEYKKQQKEARINQIDSEVDQIKNDNYKKDISQTKLQKLINNQDIFEDRLLNSGVIQYVTTVGIDIGSKEIQVGINYNLVNEINIDSVVSQIDALMPENANWHTVYFNTPQLLSCTQEECDPIIGGNYI